jgi:hypothetical protein
MDTLLPLNHLSIRSNLGRGNPTSLQAHSEQIGSVIATGDVPKWYLNIAIQKTHLSDIQLDSSEQVITRLKKLSYQCPGMSRNMERIGAGTNGAGTA